MGGRLGAWRYVAGIAACLTLGLFAFVRGTRVPLLGLVDLGFHELGHLLSYAMPEVVTAAMGSITQVAVPVGLALYFLLVRRDLLGGGTCFAWAASSAQDVSRYVADAPYERLELIGGEHDLALVLGPDHLDMLGSAQTIATVVKGLGFLLLLVGLACCAAGLWRAARPKPSKPVPALRAAEMWR